MTNVEKNLDTKNKIIKAANELFAEHGFAGTSVRDIASTADVNLSAINYHFNNKENLYWQVFDYNYAWIEENITQIAGDVKNTEELAINVFTFFVNNESAMMNTFKLFLSGMTPKKDIVLSLDQREEFGPPGQKAFIQMIEQDTSPKLSHEAKVWASEMIFSLIFHFGVMINTKFMKEKCKKEEHFRPEIIAEALRHSVRAHLAYLKTYP